MTDISQVPTELWPVSDLVPYEFNHKKHPEKQIELLAKLIEAKGLINPIVLEEDGTIIAGHGRYMAVKKLGREFVAVRVLRGISKAEASALRIADNKSVSNEYDTDMLAREVRELAEAHFDVSMLGLDQRELDMLITDVGEIDDAALTDDIFVALEAHEAEVEQTARAADEETVRLDKAFGFKAVPLPAQKTITRFMAEIEAATGQQGVDALLSHMKRVLTAQ